MIDPDGPEFTKLWLFHKHLLCDFCHDVSKVAKLRCSSCKMVYYCSADCSKTHWQKDHRSRCKAFSARRKEFDEDEQVSRKFLEAQSLSEGMECAVCFSKMTADDTITLDCAHVFCMLCVDDMDRVDFERSGAFRHKCPVCRTERNEHFVTYQHKFAVSWLNRAFRQTSCSPLRRLWLDVARREIAKLDFLEDSILLGVKADIARAAGEYEESISLSEAALAAQPESRAAVEDNHFFIAQNLTLAECLLRVEPPRLDESKGVLRTVFRMVQESDAISTRKAMALLSELELRAGNPRECISIGLDVIEMNRWYDDAYIHVARALVMLGDRDAAVRVMEKAAAYESAWDSNRVEVVRAKLSEFLAMQASAADEPNVPFDLSSL